MTLLSLSFLGPFQATFDSQPVKGFESDKVRALLAYLVVEAGQPHRRDSLAAMFWPEQTQESALKNLRHVVYKLRQVLGEADADKPGADTQSAQAPYLYVSTQSVYFNAEADFKLDVTEFGRLIAECEKHDHRRIEVCRSCHERLKRAAGLYRGSFLAGFGLADSIDFEEWMLLQREVLHRQASLALSYLATYSEARGENAQAAAYARRQLELEPWNEEAHRNLMRLLWITGQRTAALSQYQACTRALQEELGIEPSAETQFLYKSILQGDYKESSLAPNKIPARSKHNLPLQVTPFIGRDEELGLIAERLESPDRRLLTIVGPGGIGKSRLAISAATARLGTFEDGVYFVPMAPLASPDLIASTIAQAISLHFSGKLDEESQLLQHLADKEMLLVLDNLEHLLKGTGFIRKIIDAAPHVALLVTSRERLNLQAESVIEVAGLPFPPATDDAQQEVDITLEYSAVQLFVERARATQESFRLTSEVAPLVAQICRIVGGLPLAIELAAVQVLDYSSREIADAIRANLDFLSADMQDMPLMHSSIRAVFNYSWDMLSEVEQGVFRRLSVFRGGWGADSAEQIAGATRANLRSLAGKSLIRRVTQGDEVCYDIHEVLRQYAGERLDKEPAEKALTQQRHAEYFLALAEAAEPNMRGADQEKWLRKLDQEHANMQAAIRWAVDSNQREIALRLGGALWQFWVMHAHYTTGRALLSDLDLERPELSPAWAKALFGAGRLAMQQGDHANTQRYLEQSMALYAELGDDAAVRQTMIERARAYLRQGQFLRAEELAVEVLELSRAAGDLPTMVNALTHLGNAASNRSDYARARMLYTECLQINRTLEDKWGIAWTLTNLGNLSFSDGDSETARALIEESLAIRREIGDRWGIAACLTALGNFSIEDGHYSDARKYITQGLTLRREIGDAWAISESLIYYGLLEYSEERFDQARERWGQALAQSEAQQNHFFMTYCLAGLAGVNLKKGNIVQAVRIASMVGRMLGILNVSLSRVFQGFCDEVLSAGYAQLGAVEVEKIVSEEQDTPLAAVT